METLVSKIKEARIETRLPLQKKQLFQRAANIGGFRTLSEFVISTVQDKAESIIRENERIISSNKDKEVFFNALSNPTPPNEALVSAAKKYKEATKK